MKQRKGKLFIMLSLLCVLCCALPGVAQDQVNSEYGYYYLNVARNLSQLLSYVIR